MLAYKKIAIFSSIILCTSMTLKAQKELLFGGFGGALELGQELIGANARFFYGVNEAFCFGPEISFFPYQDTEEGFQESIIDLNINAHYIFEVTHKLGLYPLSGINYTIEKERLVINNDESETENEFGINYGFGAHYIISRSFVFAEIKGVIGQLSGEFITAGVISHLNKSTSKKEHEK